jgi:hypothetical protein
MDFVYHLVRILKRIDQIEISYIEFIQQVKHLFYSRFDENKINKDVLFQLSFLIYYKFIYCE